MKARQCLYILGFLTEAEDEKVIQRIIKYKKEHEKDGKKNDDK